MYTIRWMRIGIDGRFYSESGVGRYIKNLLYYLQKLDSENEYFILLRKKDFESINFSSKKFTKVLADISWYGVEEQLQLPSLLYSLKLDLVHFPHFNVPVFYRGKYVVTIHDLIHQKFKMKRATTLNPLIYAVKHRAYNYVLENALKKAEKVITVSDYVEHELLTDWKVPTKKLVVTKEGVEEKLIQDAKKCTQKQIDQTLKKYGINPPFIFYIGNAHPHKNVEGLIKAFLELRKKYQYLQLVLSGSNHYFWERIRGEFLDSLLGANSREPLTLILSRGRGNYESRGEGVKKNIIFTGFVSDQEMVALYKSCKVYVVPSFEEGFGIPLLEAMACGAPVVSSNRASLPEIGGDAAIYFDPNSVADMALKISTVLNSTVLQKELKEKGEKRIKLFSWEKMVQETISVYTNSKSS